MQVNEGLPAYIVAALERRYGGLQGQDRRHPRHGVQGRVRRHARIARYKLRKLLVVGRRATCCRTDPYVEDDRLVTLECVLEESDILVLGAPHRAYRDLDVGGKDVVDVWGALGDGIRL